MKERESLRKKIVPIIASPIMAMVIGFSVAVGGFVEGTIYLKDNKYDKAERAFPHIASPEELQKATNDVLIFDEAVHRRISSGESTIDVKEIVDPSKITQAIKLVDKEEISEKQRYELIRSMDSPVWKRDMPLATGGIFLMGVGGFWLTISSSRKRTEKINQVLSPTPSDT